MNKLEILSPGGAKKGVLELPEIFKGKINMPLLSQAIYIYQDIRHPKLAKTKTRSEVNISTRKIYRQKGTGGARHGAKSAPIFVGGGVTHGPKGVKRLLKLPAKLVKKALQSALLSKLEKNQIKIVESLSSVNKTKEASVIISKIVGPKNKKITVVLPTQKSDAMRFWRNIAGVNVVLYKNLNAYLAYFGGTLLFDSRVFGVTRKTSAKKKTVKKTTVAKK